jgi:sugar phosphate isomerase/epimerase
MRITYSIFPKFFKDLDVHGLAALVRELGLDTTNLVVRDGYWCQRATLARDVPAFVKAMEVEGLSIHFATAGYSAADVIADPSIVQVLADNGVGEFRMDYFKATADVVGDVRRARADLERMVPVLERARVRAVYQLHHGTLVSSPSAAWHLVNGLPPEQVGVELDPGNQTYEGHENFLYSTRLLGEYVVAAGIKDSRLTRDETKGADPTKGWRREWWPMDEGVTNWHEFVRAMAAIDFHGTFVMMGHYDQHDLASHRRKLKREVAYLKRVVREVGEEASPTGVAAAAPASGGPRGT